MANSFKESVSEWAGVGIKVAIAAILLSVAVGGFEVASLASETSGAVEGILNNPDALTPLEQIGETSQSVTQALIDSNIPTLGDPSFVATDAIPDFPASLA